MRKTTIISLLTILAVFIFAMPVYAGVWDNITSWVSGTAVAFILTGLLAVGVIAKYTNWISSILVAVGLLMISIGNSTADGKITKEELKEIKDKLNSVRKAATNMPV